MKKRLLMLMTAFVLLHTMIFSTAAAALPDLSGKGSLTIQMVWNGEKLNSGRIRICKIADIDEEKLKFVLIDALQGEDLSLEDPMDREVAEKAANLVWEKHLDMIVAPIRGGEAVFMDLEAGLYLVMQHRTDAVDGFLPIMPYLISVPYLADEEFSMDVVAAPKVPMETKPTRPTEPPPTRPNDPHLPQTGQLNWPVPMLAVGGLTLFLVGWFLYNDGYRKNNEA